MPDDGRKVGEGYIEITPKIDRNRAAEQIQKAGAEHGKSYGDSFDKQSSDRINKGWATHAKWSGDWNRMGTAHGAAWGDSFHQTSSGRVAAGWRRFQSEDSKGWFGHGRAMGSMFGSHFHTNASSLISRAWGKFRSDDSKGWIAHGRNVGTGFGTHFGNTAHDHSIRGLMRIGNGTNLAQMAKLGEHHGKSFTQGVGRVITPAFWARMIRDNFIIALATTIGVPVMALARAVTTILKPALAAIPITLSAIGMGAIALVPVFAGVGQAIKGMMMGGEQGAKMLEQAMAKLSPQARNFITALQAAGKELKGWKNEIQDTFFKEAMLDRVIQDLTKNLKLSGEQFKYAVGQMGALTHETLNWINTRAGVTWMQTSLMALGDTLSGVRKGITPLADGFAALSNKAAKYASTVGNAIGDWMTRTGKWLASIDFDQLVRNAKKPLQQMRDLFSNTFAIIGTLFKYATAGMLSGLVELTGAMRRVLLSPDGLAGIKTFFDNLSKAIGAFRPAFMAIFETVLKFMVAISPYLPKIAKGLSDIIVGICKMAQDFIPLIVIALRFLTSVIIPMVSWLARHREVLYPLIGAIIAFTAAWKGAHAIGSICLVLKRIDDGLKVFDLSLKSVAERGLKGVITGIKDFSKALFTTPIGWICLGIMAIIVAFKLLWDHSAAFRNFWKAVWEHIREAASAVWNWLYQHVFQPLIKWFRDHRELVDAWKRALKRAWEDVGNAVKKIWDWQYNNVYKPLHKWYKDHEAEINKWKNAFKKAWDQVHDAFSKVWKEIKPKLEEFVKKLKELENKTHIFSFLMKFLLVGAIIASLAPFGTLIAILKVATWILDKFDTATKRACHTIQTLEGIVRMVTFEIQGHWSTMINWLHRAWSNVCNHLHAAWSSFANWFTATTTWVCRAFQGAWNAVYGWLSAATGWVCRTFQSIWSGTTNWFHSAWSSVCNFLHSSWSSIANWFTGAVKAVTTFFSDSWQAVKNFFIETWNSIYSFLKDVLDGIKRAFESAVDGIKWVWDKLRDAAKAPVSFVINTVYNEGIVRFWNGIAEKIGMGDKKLEKISGFAEGGRIPGSPSQKDNTLAMVASGEYIMPTDKTQRYLPMLEAMRQGRLPGYVDGGLVGDIKEGTGEFADWVKQHNPLAKAFGHSIAKMVDVGAAILKAMLPKIPGGSGVWTEMITKVPRQLIDWVADYLKKVAEKKDAENAARSGGGGGAGKWASLVAQALQMCGAPAGWLPNILTLIDRESGGNPRSINLWDSNAQAGQPSQGLMQCIPSTFAAHHLPGTSNDIMDPLANVCAGIRYIMSRYNGGLPQQANPGAPPMGYDNGGYLMPGKHVSYNGTGQPERVLDPVHTRKLDELLDRGLFGGSLKADLYIDGKVFHDIARVEIRDNNNELARALGSGRRK